MTPAAVEAGDAPKIMAVPWQTDYNPCAMYNTATIKIDPRFYLDPSGRAGQQGFVNGTSTENI